MENNMEDPQKTENRAPIWSTNPTPRHVSRQNWNSERYMLSSIHSSTIYISQDMEATEVSTDRQMDKEVQYIMQNGLLATRKK